MRSWSCDYIAKLCERLYECQHVATLCERSWDYLSGLRFRLAGVCSRGVYEGLVVASSWHDVKRI